MQSSPSTANPLMHAALPDMDKEVFQRWKTLLEERTGMCFAEQRKSFLQTSVGLRMREIGFTDYDSYYQHVRARQGTSEWLQLLDRLTIKETRFFRDDNAFSLVKQHLSQRLSHQDPSQPLHIWSLGCATGEEAYSLAILIEELFAELNYPGSYGISASDISTQALQKARQGIYAQRKLELMPSHLRNKYFNDINTQNAEIIPRLRQRVCFAAVNALQLDRCPLNQVDLIFCQNLLIYFRRWRRKIITEQLANRLAPGGLLILGVGELMDWRPPQLTRANHPRTLAYCKPS